MEEQKEVLDVITDLNDEMYERGGLEYITPFEFRCIGYGGYGVEFMGIMIWHTDNDVREWVDEDTREPFKKCFIREANKILKDLNLKMGAF